MPDHAAYDLEFRPESYWDAAGPIAAILSNVKGDRRRRMVRDVLTAGGDERAAYQLLLGDFDPALYDATVDEAFRTLVARAAGPQWMGGEYLPDTLPGEVEIARIVLDSTTRDVYSVRARRRARRILYRIVDEYQTVWRLTRKSSTRPLSMRELTQLIDTATFDDNEWDDLTDALRDSTWQWDGDTDEAMSFVTVESELYPELEAYYEAKALEWAAAARAKSAEAL